MKKIEEIKEKLRELKPLLQEKYKVSEIGIFGSYIKEEQRKRSDLDILVDFYEVPDLWTYIELKDFLSKKLKVKVDLVMKSALKPYIGKIILQEVVYI
ncbi:nucleotidyltransferase family protein [Thermodesulfovibrio sp. 3907-1M]|uniref:Nucleotidyltransferase family protein n=1 Tax=Thermodesulfovibrio autotrophicus TaxID=3118333 RepID=A0AAU8GX01_9BACT